MACDICGRGNCTESFHLLEEQRRYENVINAFEKARELRAKVRGELEDEEAEETQDDDANCIHCGERIRGIYCRCTRCGRDAHEGFCASHHEILCYWHHAGICDGGCPFCRAGEIVGKEAIGG